MCHIVPAHVCVSGTISRPASNMCPANTITTHTDPSEPINGMKQGVHPFFRSTPSIHAAYFISRFHPSRNGGCTAHLLVCASNDIGPTGLGIPTPPSPRQTTFLRLFALASSPALTIYEPVPPITLVHILLTVCFSRPELLLHKILTSNDYAYILFIPQEILHGFICP